MMDEFRREVVEAAVSGAMSSAGIHAA